MRILAVVVVLLVTGCAGLTPRLVDASVQKPSNVAVYFTVDTRDGEPVPGLTAEQFHIYEDGKLVSPYESKQTILNPEIAAKHYTLLLVDMSGSVSKSGQLPALQEAVNAFTSKVGQYQETAVYAFDGRPDIFPLRNFAPGASTVNVSGFATQDPSTNLNGAAIKAMELLDKHLDKSPVPLRFGTLVVFTDGTDHASRATKEQLMGWVNAVPFDIFVIGVGAEINEAELSALGRSGAALSRDPGQVGAQFDKIATRIEGYSKRFYLLSYCSPARAGDHVLTVEPFLPDGRTGETTYRFNANGFGPNCDPNRKPSFDIKKPRTSAQRP
ncbi:MAG: VWA domain-containing protein [Myxococcaceae bacterium]|nr:VWA domain-containing protein [Myxococcaceae bacterium]